MMSEHDVLSSLILHNYANYIFVYKKAENKPRFELPLLFNIILHNARYVPR